MYGSKNYGQLYKSPLVSVLVALVALFSSLYFWELSLSSKISIGEDFMSRRLVKRYFLSSSVCDWN